MDQDQRIKGLKPFKSVSVELRILYHNLLIKPCLRTSYKGDAGLLSLMYAIQTKSKS